jgi:hypothetical protein
MMKVRYINKRMNVFLILKNLSKIDYYLLINVLYRTISISANTSMQTFLKKIIYSFIRSSFIILHDFVTPLKIKS